MPTDETEAFREPKKIVPDHVWSGRRQFRSTSCVRLRLVREGFSLPSDIGESTSLWIAVRWAHEIGDRRGAECQLCLVEYFVKLRVQRAKLHAMLSQSKRADVEALDRIDGIDDVEHRDLIVR